MGTYGKRNDHPLPNQEFSSGQTLEVNEEKRKLFNRCSEKSLLLVDLRDTVWEQLCLSDQSAIIDVSLYEQIPDQSCANAHASANKKSSMPNLYAGKFIQT